MKDQRFIEFNLKQFLPEKLTKVEFEQATENEKEAGNNGNASYTTSDLPTWCFECRKPTEMVSTEEAATVANVTPLTIFNLVEQKSLHYQVTTSGNLYICLNSLMQIARNDKLEAEIISRKTGNDF